ncbi:secretin and TonB N-terminal domain-containing protein [Mucilaginibacter flavidus]|uniref:secretin and TonB N-terminal domain-containing protein n=1 Tax=Mucilaginibacter flavidus TaxID=2949309 RepID=UPI002091F97E|nr:secretin and TonB N-terminal domain-containing protein [Mucilaginibacter flavidus]MCO5949831.1 secretin and TonB N-terminal domain-containing protein [Mucilaginibacter flavidus]
MQKKLIRILFFILLFTCPLKMLAQQNTRIQVIQRKLDSLSKTVPGLNQKVQLFLNGTLQQYLMGISSANGLSISVDPKLSFSVNDNFTDVTATNILVFLAQKYNLDIAIVGSIIYVTPYVDPAQFAKPPVKEIIASYNHAENKLSLTLDNDSLTSVARKITQVSGKNVVVPSSLQTKKVSAFIAAAPFETALDKLAFSNEIKMIKTSDNFFLFQPLGENEELYINGDKNTSVRKTFRPPNANPGNNVSAGVFSRVVNGQKLISADAVNAPIINLVKQASQELNISYSIYSDIKGTIDIHVNDVPYEQFLNLLFRGTDYTYQAEDGIYLIGDKKIEGLRTYKALHLQNRAIDTVVAMIPVEWKKGLEIKEFREQNTLLLSGSAAQIREVENFVKQLDVLVPVVLIEVTMIDFRKSRSISTGISAGVADSVKTGGTVLPGVDFTFSASSVNSFLSSISKFTSVNLGHVVPNFYVKLQALETNNNVDIRSVPKLTAMNGHSATLSIGSRQYYKNTTQNLYNSAANNTSVFTNVYTPVDANLSVDIKPLVSGDDQVTLGIKVNISDFTSVPTDGSPPPQSISKFETSLRVHSEDTILLGGIERTENDSGGKGFPILSRIPVLKWIFGSRTKSSSKVVTVLFIKSTIMR